jgi:hypothetical protein
MSLVDRVKAILITPQKEWPVIEAETATPASLYIGYIIPLAAIGPVAGLIGMSMFGFAGVFKVPMGISRQWALIQYVSTLVGVFVLALIIDALAPQFGGTKSQIQALKLAAYAWTAAWVAGIFRIIPSLGILKTILGLYSLYLFFLGLPVMMKPPQDKSVAYTVVVILVAIVIVWAIEELTWRVMGLGPMMSVITG